MELHLHSLMSSEILCFSCNMFGYANDNDSWMNMQIILWYQLQVNFERALSITFPWKVLAALPWSELAMCKISGRIFLIYFQALLFISSHVLRGHLIYYLPMRKAILKAYAGSKKRQMCSTFTFTCFTIIFFFCSTLSSLTSILLFELYVAGGVFSCMIH